MKSKNQKLGLYDMVLSLSESKVNHELENLLLKKVIHPSWQFFTNGKGDKTKVLTASAADETEKKIWLNRKDGEEELERLEKELRAVVDKLIDAEGAEKTALKEKRTKKEQEIDALKEQLHNRPAYTILVDAVLDAPSITILSGTSKELLFKQTIKSGFLYHLDGDTMEKIDLSKVVYAFHVPIGSIGITTEEMVLLDGKDKKRLRSEGISDQDFTINALMLNFEHAEIANYSVQGSKFPAPIKDHTQLQVAFTNFFKSIGMKKDNPYILGYEIKKKKLAEREKALLYPTYLSHSTSYGTTDPANPAKPAKGSAFNFLMQTNNNSASDSNAAGVLEKSLLEELKDQSGTMSGVMAVNYDVFKELYMTKLHNIVIDKFSTEFGKHSGTLINPRKENKNHVFELKDKSTTTSIVLEESDLANDKGKGKFISYNYTIRIKGHLHKKKGIQTYDWDFSTSGEYKIKEQHDSTGKEGSLCLTIGASDKGKLQLTYEYVPPTIGWDTKEPKTTGAGALNFVLALLKTILSLKANPLLEFLVDMFNENSISFDSSLFENYKFDGLENLSSKVVLPASNVYTYKNVRLLDGSVSETDAVLFDIAYAPASF